MKRGVIKTMAFVRLILKSNERSLIETDNPEITRLVELSMTEREYEFFEEFLKTYKTKSEKLVNPAENARFDEVYEKGLDWLETL